MMTNDECISQLLGKWDDLQEQLMLIFRERNKEQAAVKMERGIALMIEFLHRANDVPVQSIPAVSYEKLQIKPLNIEERLNFILARPHQYQSFMQLCELMVEMEKAYIKAKIVKKSD